MSVRKITSKTDRVKVVNWIRSGAPLKDGALLYASLPYDPALLIAFKENPRLYAERLINDICNLMDISRTKFQSIINQYHGTEQIKKPDPGSQGPVGQTKRVNQSTGPEKISRQRSFRSQWPFLARPECPPQLKALAADKISAWERYTEAHRKLFDCSSLEECYQVAHELIENVKENRLIYEELDYYRQHGTPLGKHPVWTQFKRFENLRDKNIIELVRMYEKTLPHRIWRIESEIKKGDKPHLQGEREQRLKEVQAELAEVKRILGINAG